MEGKFAWCSFLLTLILLFFGTGGDGTLSFAGGLQEIRNRGAIHHLGVPYAHFVYLENGEVKGLDVELMRLFARHIGVAYQWVPTRWSRALGDLTGIQVRPDGDGVQPTGKTEIKGDILANGLTILHWRERVVTYSLPTFPTGVWLMARADSPVKPISPSGDFDSDIRQVRRLLEGRSILAMENTCLDPELYRLEETGVEIRLYTASENLGELAPAVIRGEADTTLLDIPDALVALQTWPGKIRAIGPVSPTQSMGVAVAAKSNTPAPPGSFYGGRDLSRPSFCSGSCFCSDSIPGVSFSRQGSMNPNGNRLCWQRRTGS